MGRTRTDGSRSADAEIAKGLRRSVRHVAPFATWPDRAVVRAPPGTGSELVAQQTRETAATGFFLVSMGQHQLSASFLGKLSVSRSSVVREHSLHGAAPRRRACYPVIRLSVRVGHTPTSQSAATRHLVAER